MILAGQLSANVTISPAEDLLDELDETVVLTLGAPTNAGLGATTAHTATITDNDAEPTVAFAQRRRKTSAKERHRQRRRSASRRFRRST